MATYSMENSMDRGAWQATVHGVANNWTRLSNWHFSLSFLGSPWLPTCTCIQSPEGMWSKVQLSSVAQSCPTLCNPMNCSTPGLPVHQQLPEFTQTHVHWVSDAIQPPYPLSSPSPAFSLSQHQGLFKLISFRMGWLDLLAVQGTLESLLQHHSSKSSFLRRSAFFIVQLSHPYMTTGKTIAFTRHTFVDKVSLCFLICCLGWS